jgi:DnaJ-class molecular chaperone
MSDACSRCLGKGIVPKVPGDPRVMVPCRYCAGTGRRGGK